MDENLIDIIKNYKDKSNKDLTFAMEKLSDEFEATKKLLFNLSTHLDKLEKNYMNLLNEYKKRNNG